METTKPGYKNTSIAKELKNTYLIEGQIKLVRKQLILVQLRHTYTT